MKSLFYAFVITIALSGWFHPTFADGSTYTVEEVAGFRDAAEKGDSDAQFQLGEAYQKGEGVRQDDTQAAKWYQASADQGNPDGQFAIGFAYRGGFGVPKDLVLAYMWFDLAAARGSEEALDLRSAVAELMSNDQINDARKRARQWKPVVPEKAAEAY